MISQENLEKIKKIIHEFFRKMEIEGKVEIGSLQDLTIPIEIEVDRPQILIGEKGQTLAEIQHLLKLILRKQTAQNFFVDLDINEYKKKKIEYLKEVARTTADEVALTKKEKILAPMSSYERRIIHLELAERSDVVTESIGSEPERKVVIRPYP